MEQLPYGGQSAKDRLAFDQYRQDIQRGKSLLQLKSVAEQITPDIRNSWSARSFTPVSTPEGVFDGLVCNISYHYNKHGHTFGNIALMTTRAKQYLTANRHLGKMTKDGLLQLPNGSLYEPGGKIVTFFV